MGSVKVLKVGDNQMELIFDPFVSPHLADGDDKESTVSLQDISRTS